MKEERTYTRSEIMEIIDREIKKNLEYKNEYIKENGFGNISQIRSFDTTTATLTNLYRKF